MPGKARAEWRGRIRKRQILVVDDDPDVLTVLTERLVRDGFSVTTAFNGRDALERLRGIDPDVILLDLHMPIMSGLEMLRAIRQANDPVPVITMTASWSHDLKALSLKAGANVCLLKPFEYAALKTMIETLLQDPLSCR